MLTDLDRFKSEHFELAFGFRRFPILVWKVMDCRSSSAGTAHPHVELSVLDLCLREAARLRGHSVGPRRETRVYSGVVGKD